MSKDKFLSTSERQGLGTGLCGEQNQRAGRGHGTLHLRGGAAEENARAMLKQTGTILKSGGF